jgi:hypothetical protein
MHDNEKQREMVALFTRIAVERLGLQLHKISVNFMQIRNPVGISAKTALVCGVFSSKSSDQNIKLIINESIRGELQAVTICHELIHVNQVVAGRFKILDDGWVWEGCAYPLDTPYHDRPWEVEAEKEEKILYDQVFKEFEQLKREMREMRES